MPKCQKHTELLGGKLHLLKALGCCCSQVVQRSGRSLLAQTSAAQQGAAVREEMKETTGQSHSAYHLPQCEQRLT